MLYLILTYPCLALALIYIVCMRLAHDAPAPRIVPLYKPLPRVRIPYLLNPSRELSYKIPPRQRGAVRFVYLLDFTMFALTALSIPMLRAIPYSAATILVCSLVWFVARMTKHFAPDVPRDTRKSKLDWESAPGLDF
jgi:hypothetical protein